MTLTDHYLLNTVLVGLVVLQIRGHRVTIARLVVPVVLTIWGASQFLRAVPTAGNDVVLEATLVLAGCLFGVLAGMATGIHRDGEGAVARAGAIAALLWVIGIGARVGFYGLGHPWRPGDRVWLQRVGRTSRPALPGSPASS